MGRLPMSLLYSVLLGHHRRLRAVACAVILQVLDRRPAWMMSLILMVS